MNPTHTSDVSLYELVLNVNPTTTALQVSPATLKAVSDALINLLIDQEISAIIWAKLPRGETWWEELHRYTALNLAKALYFFGVQRDSTEATEIVGMPNGTVTSGDTNRRADNLQTAIAAIQLAHSSTFRREYFLIIWSESFKGAVFAHRPRSAQTPRSPEGTVPADLQANYTALSPWMDSTASTTDRKQLLLAVQSFDVATVEHSLTGLATAIAAEAPTAITPNTTAAATLTTSRALIEHWTALKQTIPATPSNPQRLEALFAKNVQYQEELWQRSSTYRKQAEQVELLQHQNEDLNNTLRLKDEFLNTVGQELRTPLTTVKTALSLLESSTLKAPQRQKYMDLIAKECDRQSLLITSLLDLVQLEQLNEQSALPPIRLVEVVPGVVSTYHPVAQEKGVRLGCTIPDDLPPVACMANWLKQIVINLVHNGIKYTPNGGQVWVRASQQGDYLQLEVRDTGIGIVQTEIPKIFDRFYRIRQAADDASGVGLGLTIVQQLLLHCGGSISVRSKVGEGSVFNVLLPIYKQPSNSNL